MEDAINALKGFKVDFAMIQLEILSWFKFPMFQKIYTSILIYRGHTFCVIEYAPLFYILSN